MNLAAGGSLLGLPLEELQRTHRLVRTPLEGTGATRASG
jgi:hypothetical protein